MTERPVRLITARRAVVAVLAAVALVAACESKLPTDAEVRDMDAETAVRSVAGVANIDPAKVTYIVDGQRVSPLIAKEIAADRITSISVENGKSEIYVTTDDGVRTTQLDKQLDKQPMPGRVVEGLPLDRSITIRDSASGVSRLDRLPSTQGSMKSFTGVLVIDGVVVDRSKLAELERHRIESVEVVKGATAVRRYGATATNGVIIVKTKPQR